MALLSNNLPRDILAEPRHRRSLLVAGFACHRNCYRLALRSSLDAEQCLSKFTFLDLPTIVPDGHKKSTVGDYALTVKRCFDRQQSQALVESLLAPASPNKTLRTAARDHRKRVTSR